MELTVYLSGEIHTDWRNNDENQHALKEIDASASAVAKNVDEVVKILQYSSTKEI